MKLKLKLTEEGGIHILQLNGELDSQAYDVLKAGVIKLFRDGKNKMILDFKEAVVPDSAIFKDLGNLNSIARELAGEIILIHLSQGDKIKVESLAKPALIQCYETKEAALQILKKVKADKEESDKLRKPLAAGVIPPVGVPAAAPSAGSPEELRKLKKELASVKAHALAIKEGFEHLIASRRIPDSIAVLEEKMRSFEEGNLELLNKIRQLENEKGK